MFILHRNDFANEFINCVRHENGEKYDLNHFWRLENFLLTNCILLPS